MSIFEDEAKDHPFFPPLSKTLRDIFNELPPKSQGRAAIQRAVNSGAVSWSSPYNEQTYQILQAFKAKHKDKTRLSRKVDAMNYKSLLFWALLFLLGIGGYAAGVLASQTPSEYVTTTTTHTATVAQPFSVTFTRTTRITSAATFTRTTGITSTITTTMLLGLTEEREAIIVHWYTIETADGSKRIIWDRISTNTYRYYRSLSHALPLPDYVTYRDGDIVGLAQIIKDVYGGDDLKEIAETMLDVVQQLHYEYDIDPYAKYPVETLCEGSGDCEDLSILYAALMKALGYDVILIQYSDHVQTGVHISGTTIPNAYYYEVDGKKYFICETTGEKATGRDWDVGECPEEYQDKSAKTHRIP